MQEQTIISAEQVANYVVCPEAWRLKFVSDSKVEHQQPRSQDGRERRRHWVAEQELSNTLRSYAKIVYLLTVLVVIVVFLLDIKRNSAPRQTTISPANISAESDSSFERMVKSPSKHIPPGISLLLLIVGLLIFLWDLFERRSSKINLDSGLSPKSEMISAKESQRDPTKLFVSHSLGLSGRPDALISEDKLVIPAIVQPMAKKIRDRHVVAMLVYLRLVEEEQGERPPYGIMIMGAKKRQVRIQNSDEKQRWLDSLLSEMRSIENGIPAVPAPAFQKCKHCDVESICEHSSLKKS